MSTTGTTEQQMRATHEQSQAWLHARMDELGIRTLAELADVIGSDKGNLSRIFRQMQSPRTDALEPLAAGLQVGVYELLVRIGAVDPAEDRAPQVRRNGSTIEFIWPA
jgi:transcriptional regulator with XRE-family HTH domain